MQEKNYILQISIIILIFISTQMLCQNVDQKDLGKSFYTTEEVRAMCGTYFDKNEMKNVLARQDSMYKAFKLSKNKSKNAVIMTSPPNWTSMMSPIENQGTCHNCWAHASTGVVEGQLNILNGSNMQVDLDELDIVDNSEHVGGCSIGDGRSIALDYIRDLRVVSEVGSTPNLEGVRWGITTYDYFSGITEIKNRLENGPVEAAYYVYEDFSPFFASYPTEIYHYDGTSAFTGEAHSVVIVSYNDTEEYWLCKNSWGSNWGDGGYFRIGYGECGIDALLSFTVTVDQSSYAKITPNLITDINDAFSYTLNDDEFIYVLSGSYTLTQSKTIGSGCGLVINSGTTINLNSNSIIRDGGTLNISDATINGLHATLVEGDTPFATKGYCGTIQAAVTAATTDDNIYIEDGPFSEGISISSKNSLRIRGGEITGNITASNSDDLYIYGTKCGAIYLSNCDEPEFDRVRVWGSGSGTGVSLYNVNVGYQSTSYSDIVVYNFATGLYALSTVFSLDNSPYPTWLMDLTDGVSANYSSNIYLSDINLCGISRYHLASYTASYIEALGCQYDDATPSNYQSGGTITYNYPASCGTYKLATNYSSVGEDEIILSSTEDEFGNINNQLKTLSAQIKAEVKESKSFDKEKYKNDFENIGEQFKEYIIENPDSKYKGVAVTTAIHCYKAVEDYEAMKEFIEKVKDDEEIGAYAERFMIDYYQEQGDYEKAIAVADELLQKADDELTKTLLYSKGLLFGYDMDKPEEAIKCFTKIVTDYEEDGMADMALNQLSIFGINELKEAVDEDETDENLELVLSNSPNPFNPTTTISYQIPEQGFVTLKVYDMLGREVASLVNNKMEAGKYSVNFNASNLASGVYIYRIETNTGYAQSKKMMLLK